MGMTDEQKLRTLSESGDCTVIVIPHDIDIDPLIIVSGISERCKFDQIHLREVIYQAERKRLDNEFKRTTEKLKATILPGES